MRKSKLTKKQEAFLTAYKDNRAVLYDALIESNVRKCEYDKWREENTMFAEGCEMCELYAVSLVENRVMDIVNNPNLVDSKLLSWYLERKGTGYAVKKEDKKAKDEYTIDFGK